MIAVLYDLDNTLYAEADFVRSGFSAVAELLESAGVIDSGRAERRMMELVESDGRGAVFDALLEEAGAPASLTPQVLVHAYRTHEPRIRLFAEALPAISLARSRGARLGIVTDGPAGVQNRKIDALGLRALVDVVVCTAELGPGSSKPSTVPFEVATARLGVSPESAAYIADDPSKDFIGPRALGSFTVRVDMDVQMPIAGPPPRPQDDADLAATDVLAATELVLDRLEAGAPDG